jgi:hypothetical protein
MTDDRHDPLVALLARLPVAAPSGPRADLVRARSLVALERKFQKPAARQEKSSGRAIDAALLLACAVYVAAAAIEALKSGWPR